MATDEKGTQENPYSLEEMNRFQNQDSGKAVILQMKQVAWYMP